MTFLTKIKDPVSSLTHFIGAVLSVIGLILLLSHAVKNATVWHIIAFSVFGASLILLYTASSVYHALNISERVSRFLKKLDHMMIFVLIAGTYTPICLIPLRGSWGWSLFGIVWGTALLGIAIKLFYINLPRWVSTLIYICMGWLVLVAIFPILRSVPFPAFIWLAAGGIAYTVGAVIYGFKWPVLKPRVFGFHELFHIFVLIGSFCHFWVMYGYVLYL